MSELEKATYDRGFYNGIREARQIFAKHLNVSTSTDEIKWDNVSKNEILSEIDNFMTKNEAYPQPQLTIPKSIAKKIDKFIKVLHFLNEFEAINFLSAMDLNGDRTPQWLKDNPMLVFAYLAGKALGVDLVKVVEG